MMLHDTDRFPWPSNEGQADLAEKHGLETLLFCPDPWALRHSFVNHDTGETARARCNRWDCLYCGPRKVDQWRQLVKEAARYSPSRIVLANSKSGERYHENRIFSLLRGEYRPPFVLRKSRTSLRKSNSPTLSLGGG
jgi:hypothetical protein